MIFRPLGAALPRLVLIAAGLASRVSAAGDAVEVPFEFVHQAIVVEVKVDGRGPFAMLFDTGVDPSAVDLRLAKELGLALGGDGGPVSGGGSGTNQAYETRFPSLDLGGLHADNVATLALDLTATGRALGRPITGVLGYSLLAQRIVQIDYPRRVVRFLSPAPLPPGAASGATRTTLAFRYDNEILVDGVAVNGRKLTANLDTGSNARFQLTPAAVAALGLEAQVAHAPVSRSVGINGASVNHEGTVDRVTIGTIALAKPGVVFYGRGTGHDHEAWGLRIGNEFLQDYVVTIDYPRGVITLERP